jgi:hypothetical protein
MSKKTIQYASQLFLSFESISNANKILIPSAKTLVLAGNNFRFGSPHNKEWLNYLNQSWDDVCIIPGLLEHSWLGLQAEVDIDEAEKRIKEEVAAYANIHYLNRKSVNVSDGIRVSGLIKWPNYIESIADDPASTVIKHEYMMQTKLWKLEEDEWVRETITDSEYSTIPHAMASYLCPLPHLVGSAYAAFNEKQSEPSFYSLYYPLYKYHQPLQGWIFGIPKTNITGYCLSNRTFLGCNSRDGPGYSPQMIICV